MVEGWNKTIAEAASLRRHGRGPSVGSCFLEVTGKPLSIREARRGLFSITRQALSGTPTTVAIEPEAVVVIVALSDLEEILEARLQTLKEDLSKAGFKQAKRRAG